MKTFDSNILAWMLQEGAIIGYCIQIQDNIIHTSSVLQFSPGNIEYYNSIYALPQALSDQRLADLLGLQSQLADIRPLKATRDAWVWWQPRFSAKATYRLLYGQMPPEDSHTIQRCRLVWKRRIPLKVRIFG